MALDAGSIFEPVVKAGISHVIQLSVAPVFLLTSVGAILNVMSNRLSRVVDRARALEVKLENADAAHAEDIHQRLRSLSRRARMLGQWDPLESTCRHASLSIL